jgi:hypothetical protein
MRLLSANTFFGTKKRRLQKTNVHCVSKIYAYRSVIMHYELKIGTCRKPKIGIKSKNTLFFDKKREKTRYLYLGLDRFQNLSGLIPN